MKTVFFDVDTQLDFLYPAGALAAPAAEAIIGGLAELTQFAGANRIPIISTADAHSEDDPEFQTWKPHCVVGTVGQQKGSATVLNRPFVIASAPIWLEPDVCRSVSQFIIEKQMIDCFTNPNLSGLLDILGANRYVVYGLVTEYCVRCAAFGLLSRGAEVALVIDAVKSLNASQEQEVIQRFEAQGGRLARVRDVVSSGFIERI